MLTTDTQADAELNPRGMTPRGVPVNGEGVSLVGSWELWWERIFHSEPIFLYTYVKRAWTLEPSAPSVKV